VKEYVLDTHAFVWWTSRPQRLGRGAARALRAVDAGKALAWVPSIVGVELTLITEAGRPIVTVAELEAATRRSSAVRIRDHNLAQAVDFALLASLADPFDRMIVAAARSTGRPLVTADERIRESGLVEVIWD
jgi:PIN domain nuclease of toxin-antitoxin system